MKLWALKKQVAQEEKQRPRANPAQIRVQKDVSELDLPSTMTVQFPDPQNLFDFELMISPDEGFYQRGHFRFRFHIPHNYPHEPPKVQCLPRIYHPNIDLEGKICLNILREDWKPVLNLNSVVVGLQFLLLEPNPEDPLNKGKSEYQRNDKVRWQWVRFLHAWPMS
ncbi:NEDD8-conjugating protein ubc12 [Dispira simplex]|nr:NEDD8-conjugating protein ubc12 [Dispira simplex]